MTNTFNLYWRDAKIQLESRNHGILIKLVRFLAFPFFLIFYKLNLSPNTATFFGFLVELAGCISFVYSHYILATVLLFFGIIFDGSDGALARIKNKEGTLNASLFCTLHHYIVPTLALIAGFINFYILTGNVFVLHLTIIVGISSAFTFHLFSLRSRNMYKYFPKQASKQDKVIANKKGILRIGGMISEFMLNNIYLMVIIYAIFPPLFIWYFTVLVPLRLLLIYVYTYISNKSIEEKLKGEL